MFKILCFLQSGWPSFEREVQAKSRGITYREKAEGTLENYTICDTREGSSEAGVVF